MFLKPVFATDRKRILQYSTMCAKMGINISENHPRFPCWQGVFTDTSHSGGGVRGRPEGKTGGSKLPGSSPSPFVLVYSSSGFVRSILWDAE